MGEVRDRRQQVRFEDLACCYLVPRIKMRKILDIRNITGYIIYMNRAERTKTFLIYFR